MSGELLVAVLAGGEGRRMGGVKALRPFGTGTLVSHALRLGRRWSDQAVVAVRTAAQVEGAVDAPLVLDDPALPGPIAGLAAALAYARAVNARLVLTLPCDMPHLPADFCERLQGCLGAGDTVAVAASAGRLHPVCALWRVEALDRLAAYVATGQSSLRGFAAACGMSLAEWRAAEAWTFANANTPDELTALQRGPGATTSRSPGSAPTG